MDEMCLAMSALGVCDQIDFLSLCTAFVPRCFTVQPLLALAGEEGPGTR